MASNPLYVREILSRIDRADAQTRADGIDWYPMARREARKLARETGLTFHAAAGIIASCSLNAGWKGNLTLARRNATEAVPVGLEAVRAEVRDILAGDRPTAVLARYTNGRKRLAFYRNIVGDPSVVTIDRWAARAAGHAGKIDETAYEILQDAYRAAAAARRLEPSAAQAVAWIVERGSAS